MPTPNTRLWTAIEESGFKRLAIAARTRITEKHLGQIVRGFRPPTPQQKENLARVLGRSVDELFANFPAEGGDVGFFSTSGATSAMT